VAQPALQEGRYVGKLIKKRLAGEKDVEPFKYFDKGSMATIGYRAAVADAFKLKVTGVLAYAMWGFIHVAYLVGWGNRLLTLYQWARNLVFTKNRNHRIITYSRAKKDLRTGRILSTGRLAAILPAASRPDDLERPLAVPTVPASPAVPTSEMR
jgi:NADH:ubiquinone reductase (H+-translocating)